MMDSGIKKVCGFVEDELLLTKTPIVFQNIFANFEQLTQIDTDFYLKHIKNIPIKLTEIDITNLQRKKIEIKAHEAINTIKTNNNPYRRYSVSFLNETLFSKEFMQKIPLPKLVKNSNYYTLNMWFGQKGYLTPIHFDGADGLILHIKGKKNIRLIPPNQTPWIYRHNYITGGQMNFSQIPSLSVPIDLEKYPLIKHIKPIEFTLNPGEILYIPAGWWHELTYLEECISLNYWYGIDFSKGPTWLLLNILACSYSTIEKSIYPATYDDVLEKIIVAVESGQSNIAKLLMGVHIESHIVGQTGRNGDFLGNTELENLNFTTKKTSLLRNINNGLLQKGVIETLL